MSTTMWPVIYAQTPTSYSPVGLWRLDGNLLDSSGNGRDLSVVAGFAPYGLGPVPGHQSFNVPRTVTSGGIAVAPRIQRTDAAIPTAGALTVGAILTWAGTFGTVGYAYSCGLDPRGSDAGNFTFSLRVSATGEYEVFWEQAGGGNIVTALGTRPDAWTPQVTHLRRSAGGDLDFFVDGYNVFSTSGLTMPTDGSGGIFSVGSYPATPYFQWNGLIADVAVYHAALTDVQIQSLAASVSRHASGQWTP